jgi:hypothetical protein
MIPTVGWIRQLPREEASPADELPHPERTTPMESQTTEELKAPTSVHHPRHPELMLAGLRG